MKLAAVGGDRTAIRRWSAAWWRPRWCRTNIEPVAPKDIHLLVAGRDAVPKFLRVCIMTSEKVLKEKGDDAVKFLAAEMSALHYALTHKAETVALTAKIIHAKPNDPRPAFVYDDAVAHHAVDPTLPLPMDKFEWIQQQLIKAGKLKKPVDLKTVTSPEYREKALKLAGS